MNKGFQKETKKEEVRVIKRVGGPNADRREDHAVDLLTSTPGWRNNKVGE